jgi:CheY-like chemotaxis protein
VVLLDLQMSGILDGVQTLAHIKKRLPDLPVIIHSAYLTEKMPELALADDFVVKPGGLAQLRRVLHWYASVGNLKRDQAKA